MPASVKTPSTSTHSKRTLRARSNTVTALDSQLPFERFSWQQAVRLDLDSRDAAEQSLQVIGRDPVARTLRGQHVGAQGRTDRDVSSGDDALSQSDANGYLRCGDRFFSRSHRHFDVADVAHQLLESDRLQ